MRTMTGSCAGTTEPDVDAKALGAGTPEFRAGRLVARNAPPPIAPRTASTAATRSQRAFGAAGLVVPCPSGVEDGLGFAVPGGGLRGTHAGTSGPRTAPAAKGSNAPTPSRGV